MMTTLEHANLTVSDAAKTASWMSTLFGWHIRWQGAAKNGGHTIHIGSDAQYLALYTPKTDTTPGPDSYNMRGGLNHLAVVTNDIEAMETAVLAAGFTPENHADYEPGRRFYFHDDDGIEYEVVQYD
ncbi:VOC family protein [uncultured Roseobacter sp.]|uniref:VOC family protein n=1 Tax=uncultured Roseobacter sp. TaxID=114847 RepID=UPI00260C44A4|nr:VOC family protein [uncultured Roseobacter sp.]